MEPHTGQKQQRTQKNIKHYKDIDTIAILLNQKTKNINQ